MRSVRVKIFTSEGRSWTRSTKTLFVRRCETPNNALILRRSKKSNPYAGLAEVRTGERGGLSPNVAVFSSRGVNTYHWYSYQTCYICRKNLVYMTRNCIGHNPPWQEDMNLGITNFLALVTGFPSHRLIEGKINISNTACLTRTNTSYYQNITSANVDLPKNNPSLPPRRKRLSSREIAA